MGQPLAQSASSDSIHVHPQSTLTPPGDDDEEPPSRHAQEIQEKVAFDKSESTSISDGGDLTTDFGRFVKTPFPFMRRRLVNDTEKQIVHDARINARRRSRFLTLFTPVHAIGPPPNYKESLRAALVYSPLNIFLVCLPVAWALHFSHQNATLVFVFSALAIIPLAALLGLGTEQIAVRTSGSVGGLLNATLGNVIELIIAGIALKKVR
jgi:Ca2+:H+ antiporter